jgi:cytidylate kinase
MISKFIEKKGVAMSIVWISRGSYSWGREIAEKVAQRLDYKCIARELLIEASEQFNIPEVKLNNVLKDAPSVLDRLTRGKDKYLNYMWHTLLRHLQKDNMVYHGLAGHVLLKDITHVVKIFIIADLEDRVKLSMKHEDLPENKALAHVKKVDRDRSRWSQYLYGIDMRDPSLYDLLIHIKTITVEDAVEFICNAARLPQFQATPESQRAMDDFTLATEVKAKLVDLDDFVEVSAQGGTVDVKTTLEASAERLETERRKLVDTIERITNSIPGVQKVDIHVDYHVTGKAE